MKKTTTLFLLLLAFNIYSQQTKEEPVNLGLVEHRNINYQEAINNFNKALQIDSNFSAAYVNRSNTYFEQKEYGKALIDIDLAIKLDPNNSIPYNNKGLILKFQNKFTEAIVNYDKAINLDKKYYEAYINKLRALLLLKKQDEATKIIENLKKEITTNPEFCIVTYVYYTLINDYAAAINELNIGVSLDSKNEKILLERARLKDDLNDEKGAIADYTKLIEINPNSAKYYYGRSSSYYDLKKYENVIENCNKAISLDKNYYEAYLMRGDVYDTFGEESKSISDYEKAISLRPNVEFTYNELGKVYFLKNQFSKALEVLNRILAINPNTTSSLEYRAGCKSKLGDFNGAIDDFNKLIALEPKEYKHYINKGIQEDNLNKTEEACKDVKKGYYLIKNKLSEDFGIAHNFLYSKCRSSLNPKDVKVEDLYLEMGELYKVGKLDLVILKFDEMMKIVPDSSFLYYNRGKMKRELNKHDEAILDYKKAVFYDKKNVEAWTAMGVSYSYTLKLDEAINANKEAIKANENYAMPYHNLALIYSEKKEYLKAIENLELAAQKDPNYTSAFYQLGINYLLINNKEKACYNFKRAESLGSIPAKLKVLSECNN
jgi:tetratricopeptide (TPR) repeat protein